VGAIGLAHNRLTDMDNLGGLVTETVDSQQLLGLPVKQDLQHADGFTGNLCSGQVFEKRLPYLVWYLRLGQLPFRLTYRADFRNRINASGDIIYEPTILILGDI